MASQDFPLIPDPHAPTRLPQTSDSTTTNADYFANPPFTPTPTEDSDPDRSGSGSGSKRNPYYYKKQKTGNNSGNAGGGNNTNNSETASEYRVDYRKDREEWSDTAIACLLEAYTEKFNQLNRGNLRGRDWEEVAETVTERCGGGSYNGDSSNDKQQQKAWKSVEQCKNKIDNLKKRYKVELQRLNSSGGGNSNWHWFKQLEVIVGSNNSNNLVTKSAGSGGGGGIETVERNAGGGAEAISSPFTRQSKRYAPSNVPLTNLKPKPQQSLKWRRVVFKISGSALAGAGLAGNCQNVDAKLVMQIAGEVATACRLGVEVAIVVGGRNFFCGDSWVSATSLDRPTAYQIGMTATVMNALLLQSALEKMYVQARVQSAFLLPEFVEPYSRQRAIRHLEKGRVVIFGGIGAGTGNPLFTTDTAAALRASEINADVVLKGTNVSGVCDYQNRKFEHISFRDVVSGNFTPMDAMALTYCEENRIPVVVFNLLETGNVSKALCGDPVGTLIDLEGRTG